MKIPRILFLTAIFSAGYRVEVSLTFYNKIPEMEVSGICFYLIVLAIFLPRLALSYWEAAVVTAPGGNSR